MFRAWRSAFEWGFEFRLGTGHRVAVLKEETGELHRLGVDRVPTRDEWAPDLVHMLAEPLRFAAGKALGCAR